jgi:D-alanyl-D-alanine-carboxypeptidase/D-alanyl-D-alanine-endopeptidase
MLPLLLSLALLAPLSAETLPRFTDPARRAKLESTFPQITALFENFWRERRSPGLVFGVVIDGELALVRGFGEQNRETHAPVTAETVFRIASMTKSFTALAILQLRDEGKLSLEDPVSKWIPEAAGFQYPTRDTAPLRIRNLLTHGAGFPEDNPWGDRQLAVSDATLTGWLKRGLPFSTPPDTAYEYSNYGFALLGRIVARCSGMSYDQYVQRHLLDPLQMRSSTLHPSRVPENRRAVGYDLRDGQYSIVPSLPHGAFGSMGGMLVSARDLGRYVAFHLSAWPPRDESESGPVRRSSVREMQHPWRPSAFRTNRVSAYGYGLNVTQTCHYNRLVAHGGGLPGFGSNMAWLPDYGVGIFVMSNLTYAGGGTVVEQAFDVMRRAGGLKARELPPSPYLASTQAAILRLWNSGKSTDLDSVAAENLYQDLAAADRLKLLRSLKDQAGSCKDDRPVEPENLMRGRFRLNCANGDIDVSFTLTPTMPPKVQRLDFSMVPKLSPAARKSIDRLSEAIAHTDSQTAHVPGAELYGIRLQYVSCRYGETLSNSSSTRASVRLDCEKGPLDVDIDFEVDGALKKVSFRGADDERCTP